jgi:hypothetical protein
MADELIAVEREGWDALVAGRGGEYYERKLAPQARMAFPFGVLTRGEAIAAMDEAPPWASYEMIEPTVVELTEDSAIVVYRAVAQRPGQDAFSAVISSTFVRNGGEWKLAFHQQSPPA